MTTPHHQARLSQNSPGSPEPLGSGCCQNLAAMIAGSVPDWSVDLHYDENGEATIIIMPEDLDDTVGPTLIVYTSGAVFHLDELRGDTYRRLGAHFAWADLLRAVQVRLIWEAPFPATLH